MVRHLDRKAASLTIGIEEDIEDSFDEMETEKDPDYK